MKKKLAFLMTMMFLTAWVWASDVPETKEEIIRIHVGSSPVAAAAMSAHLLAAASQDGTVMVYSIVDNKELFHEEKIFTGKNVQMTFDDQGQSLAVADGSGQAWVFPLRQPFKPEAVRVAGDVVCLVYDTDKSAFKAVMADGKVLTLATKAVVADDWDLGGTAKITAFRYYPQSGDYLVGRADGQVEEGAEGKVFHSAQTSNVPIVGLATSGEQNQNFVALDSGLNLNYFKYDESNTSTSKKKEIQAVGQSALTTGTVNLTALSKDGSIVSSLESKLDFYRYDFGGLDQDKKPIAPSSRDVGSTTLDNLTVTALAISDDSKYLAVGLNDGSLSYRRHPILLKTFLKFIEKEQAAEQKQHYEAAFIMCMQANGVFPQPWLLERSQEMRAKEMEQRQEQQEKLMQMQRHGQ